MNYTVSSLTTPADCDMMLDLATKERNDLSFRKIALERQKASFADNSVEINVELQAANAEYAALQIVIPSLPEGATKALNVTKLKRLELKLFLLNSRKESYGSVALLDKEFDLARATKELEESEAFIAAITARKAAL